MQVQDHNDLLNLDDKLNLTGQVARLGDDSVTSGGFADIWEGLYDGKKVAVKVIREVGTSRFVLTRRLVRETRAWAKLHHRNVLLLLGFTYGFGAGQLASLVSPWMPKGTANVYLKDQPAAERFRVVTEIADGLSYLHRHDVVHGDLKGENILCGPLGEPRLADFGLSHLLTEVNSTTGGQTSVLGSVRWMARELFEAEADVRHGVTCETDVWAYGMVVLELFTSLPPYHYERNDIAVIINVHRGVLPQFPSMPCGFTEGLWALCNDCWNSTAALRPTMRDIAKRMWDLELGSRLRSQKRRSPEAESTDTSDSNTDTMESPRLRKSPKLGLLDDEWEGSPGTPVVVPRTLVPSMAPRSRASSTSTMNTTLTNTGDIKPRHLPSSYSEWDAFPSWHAHRLRGSRTYSEPSSPRSPYGSPVGGLGLTVGPESGGSSGYTSPELPSFDASNALVHLRSPQSYTPSPSPLRQSTQDTGSHTQQHWDEHHDSYAPRNLADTQAHSSIYRNDGPELSYHSSDYNGSPGSKLQPGASYPVQNAMPSTGSYHAYSDFLPSGMSKYSSTLTPTGGSPSTSALRPNDALFADSLIFDDFLADEPLGLDGCGFDHMPSLNSEHRQPVDFTSMPHNVFSPALSEITPSEAPLHCIEPSAPAVGSDSPAIFDYGDFGDLDGTFDAGLDLFGGVGATETRETEPWLANTPPAQSPRHSPHLFAFPLHSAPPSPALEEAAHRQVPSNFSPLQSPILSSG